MLKRPCGFTLIEVLVTLLILVFGLLGLAGLIVKGQRAGYEAYQRHQALTIANDLAERIKANQAMQASAVLAPPTADNIAIADRYAAAAALAIPLGDPAAPARWNALMVTYSIPDCGAVTCDRGQLADYDIALWEGMLLGVAERRTGDLTSAANIGGIVNARGCVEGPLAAPAAPNTYRVSVTWQGDVPTAAPISTACASGLGLYRNAQGADDDTTRRAVSMDITIFVPL